MGPLIKQGWMRAAIFVVVYFTCAATAGFVAGVLVIDHGNVETGVLKGGPVYTFIISLLFMTSVVMILLTLLFRRFIDRQSIASMGFAWKPYRRDAMTGFLLGPAVLGAGSLVLFAHKNLQWSDVAFHGNDLLISLGLMIVIAVAEEMVFRGYILNNLMQSMPKYNALLISGVLFAIAHAGNPGITTAAMVNLVLGGCLLGINYIYTRNLWFGILFHFAWNFFEGPVLGYEVSGLPLQSILQSALNGPGWLTGGPFGFEGSVVGTAIFLISLLLLRMAYENKKSESRKVRESER